MRGVHGIHCSCTMFYRNVRLRSKRSARTSLNRCVVNIQQLRQSLKVQWLNYYREHRDWLIRIGVWVTCEGKRRPSSSFILATLSVLEPKLTQLLPLVVDLSSNPDRIVTALGLNFNPDEELEALEQENQTSTNGQIRRMLPGRSEIVDIPAKQAIETSRSMVPRSVIVESSVKKPTQTLSTQPIPTQPTSPQPKQVEPSHSESSSETSSEAIDAPFGKLPDNLTEPIETEDKSETENQVNSSESSTYSAPYSASEAASRPTMDTTELAAGEFPKREQASAVDETCEGVRGRSVIRNRKDSR